MLEFIQFLSNFNRGNSEIFFTFYVSIRSSAFILTHFHQQKTVLRMCGKDRSIDTWSQLLAVFTVVVALATSVFLLSTGFAGVAF